MHILILTVFIQLAFVLHIIKTGRNTAWIWIVVMLPLAGSIAYLIVEVLPDILGSRSGRKASTNLKKILNPNKNMNGAAHNYSVSDTVENSLALAEECLNKSMFIEAKELYTECLKGVHKHDPDIMYGLAKAEFFLNNFSEVKSILDDLIEQNPDYKNPNAHLLYARNLENLNETELALKEYETLDIYFPGPEATYRYALLLKNKGEDSKSRELFEKIIHYSSISGKHYNSLYKEWVKKAKDEINH